MCAGALVAGSSVVPASASTGIYTYARSYVKGQVSVYTYTEDESVAGLPQPELTAVARLKSYVRGGIGNLHDAGRSVVDPTPLSGNFSSASTPVGQDLIQLTTSLTSLTDQQVTFTSYFQPPPGGGLNLTAPFMDSPVCGSVPNNFEEVSVRQTGGFRALWGCEQFTVTTVVSRSSGQIVSAQMSNLVQLDLTNCQDEALTECGADEPLTIQRTVTYSRN
jgi:hypothetical protein